METKKAKIIMLPTEDKSQILLHKQDRGLYYANIAVAESMLLDNPQHLYITTNDEIKEGDWCIKDGTLVDCLQMKPKYGKKIIATTNRNIAFRKNIPQPSQSFIEKYCKAGGIDEVLVELEEAEYGKPTWDGIKSKKLQFKVDSHNTITIHPIKDSWSREEVEELCRKAHKNGWAENNTYTEKHGLNPKYSINNWIKENL